MFGRWIRDSQLTIYIRYLITKIPFTNLNLHKKDLLSDWKFSYIILNGMKLFQHVVTVTRVRYIKIVFFTTLTLNLSRNWRKGAFRKLESWKKNYRKRDCTLLNLKKSYFFLFNRVILRPIYYRSKSVHVSLCLRRTRDKEEFIISQRDVASRDVTRFGLVTL